MIKTGTDKITVSEMFIIMVMSRLIVTLLYIPGAANKLDVTVLIIQILFASVILMFFALPAYFFIKDGNNN